MPISHPLNLHRHDRHDHRSLITLSGEIDMSTASLVRDELHRCQRDGAPTIDVDLTAVSFCDCSGLNAFLGASEAAEAAGVLLRLHRPSPMVRRLITLTGCAELLLAEPWGPEDQADRTDQTDQTGQTDPATDFPVQRTRTGARTGPDSAAASADPTAVHGFVAVGPT